MTHSVIFKPEQEEEMADENDLPSQDGSVYHDLDSPEGTTQGPGYSDPPSKMVEKKGKCPHCSYSSKRSDFLLSHIAKIHKQEGEIPAPKKRGRKPRTSLPEDSVTTTKEEKSSDKRGRKSLPEPLVAVEEEKPCRNGRKSLPVESTSNMGEKLKPGKRGRKSDATPMAEKVAIKSSESETQIRRGRKSNPNVNPAKDSTENESRRVATRSERKSAGSDSPIVENEDQPLKRGKKRLSNDNNEVHTSPTKNKRMKEVDLEIQTKEGLDESEMMKKEIEELSSRNIELEKRLITLADGKERAEKENSNLRLEMSTFKGEAESKLQELDNAKDHIQKMSKIFSSKNAELSAMRLNEERLILDNRKLEKLAQSREEKFGSFKSTLKEVMDSDAKFCKNAIGNMSTSSDDDLGDVINFIIVDYVASKKRHMADIEKSNANLNVVQDKKDFYKNTIRQLVQKLKTLNETSKALNKKYLQIENEKGELKKKLQELQGDPKRVPETKTVKMLKAEMKKLEAEYLASMQKYMSNLDAMKAQVKNSMICQNRVLWSME